MHSDRSAVQADTHWRVGVVETTVIHLGGDNIFRGIPGSRAGDQRTHQHARNRRVAIGEMEVVVGLPWSDLAKCREAQTFRWYTVQTHSLKPGKMDGPTIQSGDGIDADSVEAVRARLIEGNRIRMSFHNIEQKVLVAHLGEARLLLRLRHALHVVGLVFLDANDALLGCGRERSLRQEFSPGLPLACLAAKATRSASHELVDSKGFFIEEEGKAKATISFAVVAFLLERWWINAEFGKQSRCDCTVGKRRLDSDSPAIRQQQATAGAEFISFGVATEVVMIIEDENSSGRDGVLAIEVGCCQPAHTSANNDQVVLFVSVERLAGLFPKIGVAHSVRCFKCTRMTATHAGEQRRIIPWSVLS